MRVQAWEQPRACVLGHIARPYRPSNDQIAVLFGPEQPETGHDMIARPGTGRSILLQSALGMTNRFFEHPILNSPYECPSKHWELDEQGQPTQRVIEDRR